MPTKDEVEAQQRREAAKAELSATEVAWQQQKADLIEKKTRVNKERLDLEKKLESGGLFNDEVVSIKARIATLSNQFEELSKTLLEEFGARRKLRALAGEL